MFSFFLTGFSGVIGLATLDCLHVKRSEELAAFLLKRAAEWGGGDGMSGARTAHVKPAHGCASFGGSGDSTPLRSSTSEVQDYGFVLMEVAKKLNRLRLDLALL